MNNLSKVLSFSTLGTLCAFLLQLISVRILSIYDYGILGKWLTDLAFFSLFFVFGLDNALLYFSKSRNKFNSHLRINVIYFTLLSFLLCIIILILKNYIYLYLVICAYFLALIQSQNAFNQLEQKFTKYGLVNLIKNLLPFLFFAITLSIGMTLSINKYFQLYTFSLFLALIYCTTTTVKGFTKNISLNNPFFKEYFIFGWKSMMNTFLAVLLYSSTIYFLNYYHSIESVAIFFAASTLAKLGWVIPDSIGNILYPKFLKIDISYDKKDVFAEMYFFAQSNFLINSLAILGFLLVGNFIIDLIYPETYKQMYSLVIILLIGNQGMVYYKILGRYLASINEWKVQRIALVCGIFSNFLMNFILTDYWGGIGAAVATSISFWICGIIMATAVKGSLIEFINVKKIIGNAISAK